MRTLLTEEQLLEGVDRLAAELSKIYEGRPLTIVGVLTGSIVLMADLIRRLDLPLQIGFVQASSYRGSTEPGELHTNCNLLMESHVAGRDVLLLDDIFDTGHTLERLAQQINDMKPASLRTAVLLRKHGRKAVAMEPDLVAFEIPNEFVVGYGLDYQASYRHLPYLAALAAEELAEPVEHA